MNFTSCLENILNKLFWIKEGFYCHFLNKVEKKTKTSIRNNNNYSIGITTFLDRFNNTFKQLLTKLLFLFPDTEILVAVNGHVKKKEHLDYLKKVEKFCARYPNVHLITFTKPQGLSKLWNQLIIHSNNDKIVILNDDLKISRSFRMDLENTKIIRKDIATINTSWSHFLISKSVIKSIGWFDERLTEIGGEDDDYAARLALANYVLSSFNMKSIAAKLSKRKRMLKVNSYGKDMKNENFGYSNENRDFILNKKWMTSNTEFEGSIFVPNRYPKYWKLRKGMETPNYLI